MFTEIEFKFENADKTINEKIEVYGTSDKPWFKGGQVAKILGYKNSRKALIDHIYKMLKIKIII